MKRFEFLRFLSTAMVAAALVAVAHAGPPAPAGGTDDFLLVSDYDTNSVKRYDAATGAFVDNFVPKLSGGLNQPQGLVFGPHDHNLYVASGELSGSAQRRAVLRYDGTTGAFIDEFAAGGPPPIDAHTQHLWAPHAVIFGPDGNLYVADGYVPATAKVIRYNGTTGDFVDDFVPANSGGLEGPLALVFGPSGRGPRDLDLYVSSARTNSVLRYDGTTGTPLGEFVLSGSGGLDFPVGLTFGPDRNLYVLSSGFTSGGSSAVLRFQGPAGETPGAFIDEFVTAGSGGLLTSFGLIFGPDGNGDGEQDLYLPSFKLAGSNKADHRFSTIKRYDGVTGGFIDTFVTANSGGLDEPNYLTFTNTDPVTLNYLGVPTPHAAIQGVPEPTCLLLGCLGAAAAALYSRKRRSS